MEKGDHHVDSDKLTLTRRELLAALGMLAVSGPLALAAEEQKKKGKGKRKGKKKAAAAPAAKTCIALQLYTMRTPAAQDLAGTLKKCREMGWEYVQWSGMPNLSGEEIKKALDDAGLKCVSAHVAMEDFEKDFATNIAKWKTVGVTDLAPGGMMNDCKKDLAAWLKGCARLEALAVKMKAEGIRLSYHNHTFELEKFPDDPRAKVDILMETAKDMNMELDVAWCFEAGVDPAKQLLKWKGRCPVIHVKDLIPPEDKLKGKVKFMPLGQGKVNLLDVFKAGKEAGVEWFTYEQDAGDGDPFDYAKASYDFMKANLM